MCLLLFYISCRLASFLRSDRDLHPNVWNISVTHEILCGDVGRIELHGTAVQQCYKMGLTKAN